MIRQFLFRCRVPLALVILCGCQPFATHLYPTGRVYLPEQEGWTGNRVKARLFGIEEVYSTEYRYASSHILYVHMELENQGDKLAYFNCTTAEEDKRSSFQESLEETGLARAKPEEKEQMTYDKFTGSKGFLKLEIQPRDMALGEIPYKWYRSTGEWLGDCSMGSSPAGNGVLPQEGPGIWLWPGKKALVRVFCRIPDGTYPAHISYKSEWGFSLNPTPKYTEQSSGLLEGLKFKEPIRQDFDRRTP